MDTIQTLEATISTLQQIPLTGYQPMKRMTSAIEAIAAVIDHLKKEDTADECESH
jgi:hypothetical protein